MEKQYWYGNVRELKNTSERMMLLTDSITIYKDDLPLEIIQDINEEEISELEEAEKIVIINALRKAILTYAL